MKQNISTWAKATFILATVFLFTSCRHNINFGNGKEGSGNIVEQTRNITEDFKFIEVSTGVEVIVEQSDTKSVVVETDDNLQELIITKVENGILYVKSSEGYNSTETPKIKVKMPVISGLSTTSGSTIKSKNKLITENIAVKSSSGSEIDIEVEADHITIETTSGSTAEVSGKAIKLETSSSSGSSLDASDLLTNDVISQSTSGSSTTVSPILSLDGKASSGSSIVYKNVPKTLTKEETSGGGVSKE